MQNQFSILINTSDGFSDCWNPFFLLFKKYWGECKYPLFLNTEKKSYSFEGLHIKSTCVSIENENLTWSQCFIKALNQIDTDIVLYFQEDYFIKDKVDLAFIENQAQRMLEDPLIKRIGLTTNDYKGKLFKSEFNELWEASNNVEYKICTQASLWRKETLISYLQPQENGWMFEILGTLRSRRRKYERFLTLNREIYNLENQPISYIHTGIIKGQWHPEIPKVFYENEIFNVNFKVRGFYNINKPSFQRRFELFKRFMRSPQFIIKSYFDI